ARGGTERRRAPPAALREGERRARRAGISSRACRHRAADGGSRPVQGDQPRAPEREDRHRHEGAVAVTHGNAPSGTRAWFRGTKVSPEQGVERATDRSDALDSLLATVRQLSQSTQGLEAVLPRFRETVAASGYHPKLLLEYARFLIRNSRGSTAEEVLALSLAKDGAQVDALELYLELARELELPTERNAWALERLSTDIPSHPSEHRAALDYAIPHRLRDALIAIEASGDPVNRAIVQINRAYIEQTMSSETLAT